MELIVLPFQGGGWQIAPRLAQIFSHYLPSLTAAVTTTVVYLAGPTIVSHVCSLPVASCWLCVLSVLEAEAISEAISEPALVLCLSVRASDFPTTTAVIM